MGLVAVIEVLFGNGELYYRGRFLLEDLHFCMREFIIVKNIIKGTGGGLWGKGNGAGRMERGKKMGAGRQY